MRLHVGRCLGGLFGEHVVVAPVFVVLPVFQQGEVDGAEAAADVGKVAAVAAVARKINLVPLGLQHEARPQGFVEIAHAAAAVVPRGYGVDVQAA